MTLFLLFLLSLQVRMNIKYMNIAMNKGMLLVDNIPLFRNNMPLFHNNMPLLTDKYFTAKSRHDNEFPYLTLLPLDEMKEK